MVRSKLIWEKSTVIAAGKLRFSGWNVTTYGESGMAGESAIV